MKSACVCVCACIRVPVSMLISQTPLLPICVQRNALSAVICSSVQKEWKEEWGGGLGVEGWGGLQGYI